MSTEDRAARLVAELDQARAMRVEAAGIDAKVLAQFFKELREVGMTEEQAFVLTHEWMVLTLSAAEEEDGDDE